MDFEEYSHLKSAKDRLSKSLDADEQILSIHLDKNACNFTVNVE